MPSPLSVDLRERVVAAVVAGASCRFRHEGQLAPKPMGGDHTAKRIEAHAGLILRISKQAPRLFLRELCDRLAEQGRADQQRAACRASSTTRHHLEKAATFAAEQERENVRSARAAWFEAQPELDPDRLVFLDETSAATNMARR